MPSTKAKYTSMTSQSMNVSTVTMAPGRCSIFIPDSSHCTQRALVQQLSRSGPWAPAFAEKQALWPQKTNCSRCLQRRLVGLPLSVEKLGSGSIELCSAIHDGHMAPVGNDPQVRVRNGGVGLGRNVDRNERIAVAVNAVPSAATKGTAAAAPSPPRTSTFAGCALLPPSAI